MRIRALIAFALAAAATVPTSALAGNPEDCSSPINLRSGQGLIANGQVVNCDVGQTSELTYSPVLPGGAADVLLDGIVAPINGDRRTGQGSYLEYDSTSTTGTVTHVKIWLAWTVGQGLDGPLEGTWGSQQISFGARDSVTAGDLHVVVIDAVADPLTGEEFTVYERTFTTATGWADGI